MLFVNRGRRHQGEQTTPSRAEAAFARVVFGLDSGAEDSADPSLSLATDTDAEDELDEADLILAAEEALKEERQEVEVALKEEDKFFSSA